MSKDAPIIACANLKGGSGKSVLAIHLAYVLQAVLVDMDPQGDSSDWARRSGKVTAHHVHGKHETFAILNATPGAIVIDTPPGEGENLRTALAACDVVVIPVKPGSSDLRALGRMLKLVSEARAVNSSLKAAVVFNEAKAGTALTREVERALHSTEGVTYLGHLGDRVAFPEAIAGGEVVSPGTPAADEILTITKNLASLIKEAQ